MARNKTMKDFGIGDRVRGQQGEWRRTGTFLGHGLVFSDLPKEGLIYVGRPNLGRLRKQAANPEHAALLAKLILERDSWAARAVGHRCNGGPIQGL
jgi:hypothetical protein